MTLDEKLKWKDVKDKEKIDPFEFYAQKYFKLTRGELEKADSPLYQKLRKEKKLENIPVKSRFGNDAMTYYNNHYFGMTRGVLKNKDRSLYNRIKRDGNLNQIPTIKDLRDSLEDFFQKLEK